MRSLLRFILPLAIFLAAFPESRIPPLFPPQAPPGPPRVRLTTEFGAIVIELYPEKAPKSVMNFLDLVEEHFYQGLTFHRVVPGFVIQGGDPLGTGEGGPGYDLPAEFSDLTHEEGMVAYARESDDVNPKRRSSGSQFYITTAAVHRLDGKYTIFGKVVEGMDVVHKIEHLPRGKDDRPLHPPVFNAYRADKEDPLVAYFDPPQRCGDLTVTFTLDSKNSVVQYKLLYGGVEKATLYKEPVSQAIKPDEPYLSVPYYPLYPPATLLCLPLRDSRTFDPVLLTLPGLNEEDKVEMSLDILSVAGGKPAPILHVRLESDPMPEDLNGDGRQEIILFTNRLAPLADKTMDAIPAFPIVLCYRQEASRFADCTRDFADTLQTRLRLGEIRPRFGSDETSQSLAILAWFTYRGEPEAGWKTINATYNEKCVTWLKAHEKQIAQLVNAPLEISAPGPLKLK